MNARGFEKSPRSRKSVAFPDSELTKSKLHAKNIDEKADYGE